MAVASNVPVATVVPGEKIGFLKRLIAFIIDSVLLMVVNQVISSVLFGGDALAAAGVTTIVDLTYFIAMWAFVGGQTLGMKALGIKLVKADGTPVTIVTAVLRYVGLIISFFALFIGVIWIAFDKNKQGWHDKIAGTYVVKA